MAFLCPMRIPRRKRKKKDDENSAKKSSPKAEIIMESGTDSFMKIENDEDQEDSDFEPRKMIVLHDFVPCVEDETPVKRNEPVKALYQENDWIYVLKRDGREGFVPFTYCISVEEYEKRKEKAKTTTLLRKSTSRSHLNVTLQDLAPSEFAKQNYGEFVVKFDFDAIDEDDISVSKGDIVVVLNEDDQDWLWVRKKSNQEGFVPRDFVAKLEQITSRSITHGGLRSRSGIVNTALDNHDGILCHTKAIPTGHIPAPDKHQIFLNQNNRRSYREINNNNLTPPTVLNDPIYKPSTKHLPIIYADEVQMDTSPMKTSPNKARVIPLSSTMSSFSPDRTLSPQPDTPILPMSSLSDMAYVLPASLSQVEALTSTFRNSINLDDSRSQLHKHGGEHVQSSKGCISVLSQNKNPQISQLGGMLASRSYSSMTKTEMVKFSPTVVDMGPHTSLSSPIRLSQHKSSNDLLLNGQELVCTDTYIAQREDEMTVNKGDWIYADLKSRDYKGWIWAYSPSTKNQGFVPKYCLRPPATTPL